MHIKKECDRPIISVIIPVFNAALYLSRCIESVLNQTYTCLEIIIVDDGSTDGSQNICALYKSIDARVIVLYAEHGGAAAARNLGLQSASGEFIGFVDADDYIAADMYEKLLENMGEGIDITCCGRRCIIPKGKSYNAYCLGAVRNFSNVEAIEELLLLRGIGFGVYTKLFRKELFRNIRFPVGRACEDLPTTYNLIKQSRNVVHIGEPKYYNCHRENSLSSHINDMGWVDYMIYTRDILLDVKKNYPKLLKQAEARYIINTLIALKQISISKQDYTKMKRRLERMLHRMFLNEIFNPYLSEHFKAILLKYVILNSVDWSQI